MRFRHHALCGVSLLCLTLLAPDNSHAQTEPLKTRAEVSIKGGSKRSLLSTEIWAPLVQDNDSVLYGDVRLMGDNDENREGNLGVGYRQIKNAVYGVHGWIDRRRTQNNSTFHQITLGVERLGHVVDLRANGYIPLNKGRTIGSGAAAGASDPYLAGSGLFYDVNGFLMEIPQYGMDAEAGYRLPILQRQADAIRLYGGGYHFFRKDSDSTTGFRVRAEAQINQAFAIGTRYQYDEPRGNQAFLEATLKFPFGAKKLYQTDGLRARLDESPERDVDIVTATKQSPTQKMIPVLNTATGEQQRVIHVDNSNTQAGDGSKENPYNTLALAQSALKDNDVLYVHHGDGTTNGMNQGITIDKSNIMMIGSGSDFIWDNGKFSTAQGTMPRTGTVIIASSIAPVLTNTQGFVNDNTFNNTSLTGNGILITGSNIHVSGFAINNTTASGVFVLANGAGTNINNITLSNLQITNSQNSSGLDVHARAGGTIGNVDVQNIRTTGNNRNGVNVQANASTIGNIYMNDITAMNNAENGFQLQNQSNGVIGDVSIEKMNANHNNNFGIMFNSTSSTMGDFLLSDVSVDESLRDGLNLYSSASTMGDITMRNMSLSDSRGNGYDGMGLSISNNSVVGNVLLDGITSNNNTDDGLSIYYSQSTVGTTIIRNLHTDNNTDDNLLLSMSSGAYGNILVEDSDIYNKIYLSAASDVTGMNSITLRNLNVRGTIWNNIRLIANNQLQHVTLDRITSSGGNSGATLSLQNQITNVRVTNSTFSNVAGNGLTLNAYNAQIDNLNITDITGTNNTRYGMEITAGGTSILQKVVLDKATLTNNTYSGLYLEASNSVRFNDMVINNSVISNNQQHGIELFSSGTPVTNITVGNTTIAANQRNGIYATSYTAMNLNLGNGTTGSGYNRIFGNALSGSSYFDIYKSYTGTLQAQYNWWGQAGGPQPGRIDGSPVITTNALATDPTI